MSAFDGVGGVDGAGIQCAAFRAFEGLEFIGRTALGMRFPALEPGYGAAIGALRATAAPVIVFFPDRPHGTQVLRLVTWRAFGTRRARLPRLALGLSIGSYSRGLGCLFGIGSLFCHPKRAKTCGLCRGLCARTFEFLANQRVALFRGREVILRFATRVRTWIFIGVAHLFDFRVGNRRKRRPVLCQMRRNQ
jgi:hypothetical protein